MHFKSSSVKPVYVAGIVVLLACRSKEPPKPPPPDPLAVQLVTPGTPPLRLLRYTLAKGSTVPFELAMDASLTTGELGGAMPTFVFDLDLTVEDVLPDGRMLLRTTITDASARDRPEEKVEAKALASRIASAKGLAITATLTPDGKVQGAKVDPGAPGKLSEAAAAQAASIAQSFEHVAMPLPIVPVGVGAKWTTIRELNQNGMDTSTINTVEVTAIDGDKVSFKLTTAIHGPAQTVVQQNTPIEVSELSGSGGGSGTLDLAHFVMTGQLDAKLHADMTAAGQKSTMDLEMKTTITPR
jgi:hypothetical protein